MEGQALNVLCNAHGVPLKGGATGRVQMLDMQDPLTVIPVVSVCQAHLAALYKAHNTSAALWS